MTTLNKQIRWTLTLRGIAALLFGALTLLWPGVTLVVLLALFGVYALADGIFALGSGLASRPVLKNWWVVLLVGVCSIVVGVLTFARPGLTALVLLFFIAARALIVGLLEIVAAVQYRKVIRGEWLIALGGAVSVLFGLMVFSYPLEGALAVMWLIGVYAVLLGITQLTFGAYGKLLEERAEELGAGTHGTISHV